MGRLQILDIYFVGTVVRTARRAELAILVSEQNIHRVITHKEGQLTACRLLKNVNLLLTFVGTVVRTARRVELVMLVSEQDNQTVE